MAKLRLGAVPDNRPVRLTIKISAELQKRLQAYADAWTTETGQAIDVRTIIPAMVEQFIRSDRAFVRRKAPPGAAPSPERGPRDTES